VVFRVVFSAAVSDFTAADVTLGGTAPGALIAAVAPVGSDGTTYDVSVSGMTGAGTVTASIAAGMAHSAAGKPNAASTSTDNSVIYAVGTPAVSGLTVVENTASNQNGLLEPTDMLRATWTATGYGGIVSQVVKVDGATIGIAIKTGAAPNSYYVGIGGWAAGNHTVEVTATDSLGLTTTATHTFAVVAPPAPVIANLTVVENTNSNHNGVLESTDMLRATWTATASAAIVSQVVKVDGKTITTSIKAGATAGSYYVGIGGWALGDHTVEVTTTDANGQFTTVSQSFTVVPPPAPVVSAATVVENTNSDRDGLLEPTDMLRLNWTATASAAITSQVVKVDGKTITTSIKAGATAGSYYVGIGGWALGDHAFEITVADANAQTTTFTGAFTVVAPPPATVTNLTVVENTASNQNGLLEPTDMLRATWTASGHGAIVSQVVRVDNTTTIAFPVKTGAAPNTYYVGLGGWPLGDHTVTVTVTDASGQTATATHTFTVVSPLTLAAPAAAKASAVAIAEADLDAIARAAVVRMAASTGNSQTAARLSDVAVRVANLPEGILGLASDATIWIDDDASGYGWYIDATPYDDSEYTWTASTSMTAVANAAVDRADLLTAVMHEMGHVLGYEHADSTSLMAAALPLGERRLLDANATAMKVMAAADNLAAARSAGAAAVDDLFAAWNDEDDKPSWL